MDTLIGSEWPSSSAQSNTFTNANDTKEIPVDNGVDNDPDDYISKHANGDFHAGGDAREDRGPIVCRNCDQPGHVARECPEPKKMTGECYNCGQVGHNKADCPNARVERPFTGTCRVCNKEGHRAADCPDKPAEKCRNCDGEGHKAAECENRRLIDRSDVPDMTKEEAWKLLEQAAADKEMSDFRRGVQALAKADPELSYVDLEKMFREKNMGLHLIARLQKPGECPIWQTRVNLQGKQNCEYTLTYSFAGKPRRKAFAEGWPSSTEENLERLSSTGEPMEQTVLVCRRCE
ncbi:MAG: hypothetical protein Q9162_004580, partial [Coniocarpon cinnabarinum]